MTWTDLMTEWADGTPWPAIPAEEAVIDAGWALYRAARAGVVTTRLEAVDDLGRALDTCDADDVLYHAGVVLRAAPGLAGETGGPA